ncbi:hypothetical protein D3C87_1784670 [compost metagenome]
MGDVDFDRGKCARLRLFDIGRLRAQQRLDHGDDDRAVAADQKVGAPVAQGDVADQHAVAELGDQAVAQAGAEARIADGDVEAGFRLADVGKEFAEHLAEIERHPADRAVVAERAGHARQQFPVEGMNVCGGS